jgi:hypothetical protein
MAKQTKRTQKRSTKLPGDLVQNHSVRLLIQKDPPAIKTQTREIRRIRIGFLANLGFSPVPSSIATFLPNAGVGWEAFRIMRISVYATDDQIATTAGTSSYGVFLSLTGIVSTGVSTSFGIGDNANFQDVGTTGQSRAQVHMIPAREFEQHWWSTGDAVSVPFATASIPLAAAVSTSLNILDLTVEMISLP